MNPVVITIPTYNGVGRLAKLLESVACYDLRAFDTPIVIVEDPSHGHVHDAYDALTREYGLDIHHLMEWSNMHGAAKKAFDYVIDRYDPRWIIYLGDDVLVTPGALSNMIGFLARNELSTVGLVLFPYWNAHDLTNGNTPKEYSGPPLLEAKTDMYTRDLDWLPLVPRHPHWDGEGFARPYVNVNGVGFAAHRKTYERAGGFAEGTWCLDESLSVRTWMNTDRSIVCLPGPPLVHYFGASTEAGPPPHHLHTHEAWERAMGMTKQQAGELSYQRMAEREQAVKEEMRVARY